METAKRPRPNDTDEVRFLKMEINTKDRELRNLRSENTRLRTHIRNIEENKQVDLAIKRQREQESNVYNHMAEIDLRNGLLAANKELENLRREYVNRLNHFKQDMNAKNAEIMDLHRTIANGRILIKNIESRLETATKDLDKKTREVFELRERNRKKNDAINYYKNKKPAETTEETRGKAFSEMENFYYIEKRTDEALEMLCEISKEEDCSALLHAVIKKADKSDKMAFRIKLNVEDAVYVVSQLNITKSQVVRLKRFIRVKTGCDPFPSMEKMNNLEKELVDSDNLEIRTHADGTIVGVLKNVKKAIETRMTDLAKSGQLLAGRKLALFGDKGGGTTKLIIVLVHLANPNSRHNILVISIFGADDTAQNMLKYIPDVLDQLNSLETISFEQNGVLVTIDVEWMLGGDIKFLCSCHGHAGASSLEFCFFCYLVNRQCTQLRDYNGDAILRTVQSYANDALTGANSVQIGSVIIFKLVKLSHVIVPSLHILMGLADRYIFVFLLTLAAKEDNLTDIEFEKLSHTKSKMKEMVKNLDNKNNVLKTWISDKKSMEDMLLAVTSVISRKISKARNPPPTCHAEICIYTHKSCKTTVKSRKALRHIECAYCHRFMHIMCAGIWLPDDRIRFEDPNEPFLCLICENKTNLNVKEMLEKTIVETDAYITALKEEIVELEVQKSLFEQSVTSNSGVWRKKLEDCWKQHGGSMSTWTQKFNGNQTYALLKPQAIDAMFDLFPSTPQLEHLRTAAKHLGIIMSMCKTERFDADDHAKFDASLKGFCSELIAAVPEDHPIVKFHMLDKHVPDFVKMFDSWAFVSEQGVEGIHAYVNALFRHYASAKNPELILRRVFTRILLNNKMVDNYNFS